MIGFGDSAIDLELRVWIEDPRNGVANVKSEVLLNILDALRDNSIEIPFPRRDVVIKAKDVLPVRMVDGPPGTST
jgi:small-conductance mechanosensitive channel